MDDQRHRLIVALDVAGRDQALDLAVELKDHVGLVKIGLEGFTAHGPDLVRAIVDLGLGVFLDLKINDIPRTAAAAVREASKLGAELVTVHSLGGAAMVAAAADAASGATQVIAVTLLTSIDRDAVEQLGLGGDVPEVAARIGALALDAGADGLVCSALELERLAPLGGKRVVPGIRPAGAAHHDQKRVATPADALASGATWLVVGRPIVAAADPVAAADAIVAEMTG